MRILNYNPGNQIDVLHENKQFIDQSNKKCHECLNLSIISSHEQPDNWFQMQNLNINRLTLISNNEQQSVHDCNY